MKNSSLITLHSSLFLLLLQPQTNNHESKEMKKLLFLILIVGVAIIMALTKPDKKAHKEAMMKAIAEYVDDEAETAALETMCSPILARAWCVRLPAWPST